MALLSSLSAGDIVEAQLQPGSWYKGKVESVAEDQSTRAYPFPLHRDACLDCVPQCVDRGSSLLLARDGRWLL